MDIISIAENYWWVPAIGGSLLIIGGILALVLNRKKDRKKSRKKTAAPVPAPVSASRPETASGPVLIGNAHHIGARESQQDSFAISDISDAELCGQRGILGVMADGMGGMADGAEASSIVVRTMLTYFNEAEAFGAPELELLNMAYLANDNVTNFMSGREKGGSTVVAVIIHRRQLAWVSVGDSRIYLVRNGAIVQLNREHTYAEELDKMAAMGMMSWEEAASDPKRPALTSYLGMGKLEQVDSSARPMELLSGDRVLLMSDGVFNALADEEILAAIKPEPQASAARIQEMVLEKGYPGQDNLTVIVFQVE